MGMKGQYIYNGLMINDAYARIDTVSSYDTNCTVSINIYANEEAWRNGYGYLEQKYPVEFQKRIGNNVGDDKTQGYQAIKQQEEWSEWEDVFEEDQEHQTA